LARRAGRTEVGVIVEEYLRRIRIERPVATDLATLSRLQAAHQQQVVFENIDVRAGTPLSLDPATLAEKIIQRGRGGFCYELNFLFSLLLEELGFRVTLLAAGVHDDEGRPGPPFDHLCLQVDLPAGPFLCDVGFGRAALRPLPLVPASNIEDPVGDFRLLHLEEPSAGFGVPESPPWFLARQAPWDPRADNEGWMPLYLFDLRPRRIEDFGERFLYHQHSEGSIFPGGLMLTRATANGRIAIRDMQWSTMEGDRRDAGEFPDYEARRQAVFADYGIELPAAVDE
jgi:N-hydroxyarylamine O-acetyltransferase